MSFPFLFTPLPHAPIPPRPPTPHTHTQTDDRHTLLLTQDESTPNKAPLIPRLGESLPLSLPDTTLLGTWFIFFFFGVICAGAKQLRCLKTVETLCRRGLSVSKKVKRKQNETETKKKGFAHRPCFPLYPPSYFPPMSYCRFLHRRRFLFSLVLRQILTHSAAL